MYSWGNGPHRIRFRYTLNALKRLFVAGGLGIYNLSATPSLENLYLATADKATHHLLAKMLQNKTRLPHLKMIGIAAVEKQNLIKIKEYKKVRSDLEVRVCKEDPSYGQFIGRWWFKSDKAY